LLGEAIPRRLGKTFERQAFLNLPDCRQAGNDSEKDIPYLPTKGWSPSG